MTLEYLGWQVITQLYKVTFVTSGRNNVSAEDTVGKYQNVSIARRTVGDLYTFECEKYDECS